MLGIAIYGMVYLGSALMVLNVYRYAQYSRHLQAQGNLREERALLNLPLVLLVLFLVGYLVVGIFGKPDLVVSGILFGGSIFVFIIFLFMRRITDKIQANERLEVELRAAEESSKAKSSFLANMSHEMRTPMNAIIGLDTIALRDPDLPHKTREQLEKIGASAHYLQSLIDDMLEMGTIESGELHLKEEPFSLVEVLEQMDIIFQGQCDEKGLGYESRVVGEVGGRYVGDALKLRRVLASLLENAVKYTNAPGSVSLVTERVSSGDADHTIAFTVRDTGIGMDEEFLPRLFEAFTLEDATTTNRYGGAGLSLAIAKRIVDLMGGSIEVESRKGEGSTFVVTVTLATCAEEGLSTSGTSAMGDQSRAEAAPEVPVVSISGRHVLIVDDIDINAEILADLLDFEGVSSDRAGDGREAVEMYAASEPGAYDAIFMDLRMPVMDGFEATRAIRALGRPDARTVPILALTANASEEDRAQALAAGMNVHLAKPVDADVLYATLASTVACSEAGGAPPSGSVASPTGEVLGQR